MSAVVFDTSALLAYASGERVAPGEMLVMVLEDPRARAWVPALCLAEAHTRVDKLGADLLATLFESTRVAVLPLDDRTAPQTAALASSTGVGLHVAHAVVSAVLVDGYLVTDDLARLRPALPDEDMVIELGQG
jgi:hypothetical protein